MSAARRVRVSELAPAVDERDFSRFVVAPLRRIPRRDKQSKQPPPERFPIACGLLGGFGGFLDESFRAHDFQLGRRNCQRFLQDAFLVPANNVVVGSGDEEMNPVIPLLGSAAANIALPRWPQMSKPGFEELCDHLKRRADAIIPHLINAQTQSVRLRIALKFGWRFFLRSRTLEFLRLFILTDLIRRNQIAGRDLPQSLDKTLKQHNKTADDVRAILAELLNPAFDFRTSGRLAIRTHLPVTFVADVLTELSQPGTPPAVRVWNDGPDYTHYERRPRFLERFRIIRWFNRWWNAPRVDDGKLG